MSLIAVDEARRRVLARLAPLGSERVALGAALGRVTAGPVVARITQPPFAASAMDGYAVRAEDVASVPAELAIVGEAPAGRPHSGAIGPGETVRIFTGGAIPEGADAIVIQEDTEPLDGGRVRILEAAAKGQYVRPAGLDFSEGEALIAEGHALGARDIAVAAAMNVPEIAVTRRPRVAIIATGDELVPPGSAPGPGQIISSNGAGLAAFIRLFGAEAVDHGIVADRLDDIVGVIEAASEADIIVTLGGASVGDHDLVQDALARLGVDLDFWRIAMRPGKPLMFGRKGELRVLGLPGNPVSALVCARIFLKPMVDCLLGLADGQDGVMTARLARALPANDRRQDYLRARMTTERDGTVAVTPYKRQDSSMLRTLADADCLIIRAPFAEPATEGDLVDILRLDF